MGIAQALIGSPEMIILDEPTVGLDPVQIMEIRDLILELGKKHTVILSSHILSEVQAICDKVLIIYKGKLVAFDTPENLGKSITSGSTIEIGADTDLESVKELLKDINAITGIEKEESEDNATSVKISLDNSDIHEVSKEIFKAFANADIPLYKLYPVKTTLEDIFVELTKDDNNIVKMEVTESDSSITA